MIEKPLQETTKFNRGNCWSPTFTRPIYSKASVVGQRIHHGKSKGESLFNFPLSLARSRCPTNQQTKPTNKLIQVMSSGWIKLYM